MAETGRLVRAHAPLMSPVTLLRVAIILGALALWEFLAHSGWLYRDVVPSLPAIGRALYGLLASPDFCFNLGVTAGEIGVALAIGGLAGLALGLLLGVNRFLSRAYEPYLYYLGPTPKIIFFPDHDHVVRRRRRIQDRARRAVLLLPGRAERRRRHARRSTRC